MSILGRIVSDSVRIPYEGVGCATEEFLQASGKFSVLKKYLSRYLRLLVGGQLGREVANIPVGARVLWLHAGKRNIGDALMEASGRVLLKERRIPIDLLTLPNLASVFEGDDIFSRVYYEASEVNVADYDYVLMTEFNHRTIKTKNRYFHEVPYACMFRYFYGPDRNQTMFSFAAINEIFSLGLSADVIADKAKPYMYVSKDTVESAGYEQKQPFITISVGGIDANRSYRKWRDVLSLFDDSELSQAVQTVVLLGSENGRVCADELMNLTFSKLNLISYVGQLTLKESQVVIDQSQRFIGCDGGLMHVAHTTSTPTVSIFANEPHHLRLTKRCHSLPLQGVCDVNDVLPDQIFNALRQSLGTSFEGN